MPERTYMVIDRRRDHSLRLPRPDLAAVTGAPDACTGCHRDRDAAWAARADRRLGRRPAPAALGRDHRRRLARRAGRRRAAGQGRVGRHLPADRARHRALAAARHRGPGASARRSSTASPTRTVWCGSGRCARSRTRPPSSGRRFFLRCSTIPRSPSASTPRGCWRTFPPSALGAGDVAARDAALAEYRASQEVDGDRPEAHLNLGNLALAQGDAAAAEREYRAAIRVDPTFSPAHVNLADVLRVTGRDEEAAAVLRAALTEPPRRRHAPPRAGAHAGAAGPPRRGAGRARARRGRRARRAALRLRARRRAALDGEDRPGGSGARARRIARLRPTPTCWRRWPRSSGSAGEARPRSPMRASSRRSIPATPRRARW